MIRAAFWNTGFAPPRGKPKRTLAKTLEVCESLLDSCDVLALCEVDDEFLDELKARDRVIARKTLSERRTRWDLAAISSLSDLRLEGTGTQTTQDSPFLKAGWRIVVGHASVDTTFALYLAHWRSRLRGDGLSARMLSAQVLRKAIDRDLEQDIPVLVLGDLNDEPFDDSVRIGLRVSRDPAWVRQGPRSRLLNLSWPHSAPPREDLFGPFGTSHHKPNDANASTLDHAIVSAHFLNDDTAPPRLRILRTLREDHYPIFVELPWPNPMMT